MGGGEEGWGGCGGRGAPPGRKLNINQSIAVSSATQRAGLRRRHRDRQEGGRQGERRRKGRVGGGSGVARTSCTGRRRTDG